MKRLVAWFDYPRFVRAEFATAQACRVLLGSNPQEVSESQERFGRPVIYVPNGFEFPSTPPVYERRVEPRFIFVGTLPYGPNLDGVRWFVREIWPRIRGVLPNATINVVGSYSGIESIVKQLSRQPGVRFTGYSTDLESMLRHAACLVVPLRLGGGTRIKIIEAWARGLPVVSTSIGCEGLGAVHLQTLFIADDPRRFADECLNLVRSPERGQRVARCAYDYGRSHFAWRCVAEDLERALCVATSLGRLDTANSHPT
jgi:glycosyltransferase involved in cell wall biosynthesis